MNDKRLLTLYNKLCYYIVVIIKVYTLICPYLVASLGPFGREIFIMRSFDLATVFGSFRIRISPFYAINKNLARSDEPRLYAN